MHLRTHDISFSERKAASCVPATLAPRPPQVCKYIDIPLQHISNLVLLSMNRPPRDHTDKLLSTLRARIPGLALRTTFISGFPGETDAQHKELVQFCKDFKFERMGCFTYSEEDGTPAADMPGQVRALELGGTVGWWRWKG